MTLAARSAIQGLWRVARDGIARLNGLLAETGDPDDGVFRAPSYPPNDERERRLEDARAARNNARARDQIASRVPHLRQATDGGRRKPTKIPLWERRLAQILDRSLRVC